MSSIYLEDIQLMNYRPFNTVLDHFNLFLNLYIFQYFFAALVPFPGMFLPMKFEAGPGHGASGLLLKGRQVTDCTKPRPFAKMITSAPRCVRYGGTPPQVHQIAYFF